MHTDLELKLPKQFKMYIDKEEVFDYPNSNKCSKTIVSPMSDRHRIDEY